MGASGGDMLRCRVCLTLNQKGDIIIITTIIS